jgi:hypothetical protein
MIRSTVLALTLAVLASTAAFADSGKSNNGKNGGDKNNSNPVATEHANIKGLEHSNSHSALNNTPASIPAVPEPETVVLSLVGLAMVGFLAVRRKR